MIWLTGCCCLSDETNCLWGFKKKINRHTHHSGKVTRVIIISPIVSDVWRPEWSSSRVEVRKWTIGLTICAYVIWWRLMVVLFARLGIWRPYVFCLLLSGTVFRARQLIAIQQPSHQMDIAILPSALGEFISLSATGAARWPGVDETTLQRNDSIINVPLVPHIYTTVPFSVHIYRTIHLFP